MQYRPEIDGLRAIAVASVLLNHAKSDYFLGGFVGVDIFFVISGFLLTFISIGDIQNGRFSLWRFYERRIRRIIPALLAVCSVTTIAAFLLLAPGTASHYLDSLVATLLFGANFYFYFETDYFAQSSELELLLHTWSLGVEEQFYLFFPTLFVFLYARKKIVVSAVLVLAASLALAISAGDRLAAFYLLPYRVWEFAVGALIALYLSRRGPVEARTWVTEACVAGGIVLMVGSACLTPEGAFAAWLIPPVLGAGLVILFGNRSAIARLMLANPAMIYTGAISYSLYLWHQPIFAIARERSIHELEFVDYIPLLVLTFVLSHLTYRLVETPFRNREAVRLSRIPVRFAGLALPMILLAPAIGAGITGPAAILNGAGGKYVSYDVGAERSATWSTMNRYRPAEAPVKVAVVGNSHAKDMWNALSLTPAARTTDFIPLISNRKCKLSRSDRIMSLFLPMRAAHERVQQCENAYPFLDSYLHRVSGVVIAPLWNDAHVDELPAVLDRIGDYGLPVLVVGNTALFSNVPQAARNLVLSGTADVATINGAISGTRWDDTELNERIETIARAHDARFLDRGKVVCPGRACDLTFDYGRLTMFDSGHWTLDGAQRFSSRMYESEVLAGFLKNVDRYAAERQVRAPIERSKPGGSTG